MSSSSDPNRRQTSRRRGTQSTTENTARSSRNTSTSYKNYFEDDDNFDPEIIDEPPSSKETAQSVPKTNGKQKTNSNLENIEKLESITGLNRTEATALLEACDNSVEKAIDIHFSGATIPKQNGSSQTKQNGSSQTKQNGNGIAVKSANKRAHNDIDNNDLISVDEDSNSNGFSYINDADNVRAPIPPKMDRLVDYDPYAMEIAAQNSKRSRTTFDGFRNMREEFNDGLTGSSKGFSALFRPPIDLLFDGSFEASKIKAVNLNKWVMLNVQCQSDFSSKCLNRDIWSDETVKEIIKANFVFVQVYYDSVEGNKLINIYNVRSYPFVAILDPRTGEKLTQYQSNKLDPCSLCEKLTSFLCENEADFKQNTSAEIVEVGDDNKSDEVVVIDTNNKTDATNGSSKTHVNGFSSDHKKPEKPKKAEDILNSNLIETIDDDIVAINDDDDSHKKSNDSYEDDSVISKDKYDKMKQASKQEPQSKTTQPEPITNNNKPTPLATNETSENYQPKILKYQTQSFEKKDCFLRILFPNGDRLDFTTNGESMLNELVVYLINQGYDTKQYELIERLMPNFNAQNSIATTSASAAQQQEPISILNITQQSRNLFNSDLKLTFKQLKLFPRVFLLLQES